VSAMFEARPRGAWLEWLPVAAGLAALYGVVFYELATGLWRSDDHAHGPIILAVIAWLLWRRRDALLAAPIRAAPVAGVSLLVFGLLLYVVGRSNDITIFEVGALAPILAGAILAMRGWQGLRALWFPILFIAFLVPLPGIFVDALTGPLKQRCRRSPSSSSMPPATPWRATASCSPSAATSSSSPMPARASTPCSASPRSGCCTST